MFFLKIDGYVFFFEDLLCLFVEVMFAVFFEMVEVGDDSVGAGFDDVIHNFSFVIGFCFSFFNVYSAFRAVADAGAEAIAEEVADKAGFVVDDL